MARSHVRSVAKAVPTIAHPGWRKLSLGVLAAAALLMLIVVMALPSQPADAQGTLAFADSPPQHGYELPPQSQGYGHIAHQDFFTDSDGERWFIRHSSNSDGYTPIWTYPMGGDENFSTEGKNSWDFGASREHATLKSVAPSRAAQPDTPAQPTTTLTAPTNVTARVSGSDIIVTWTDGQGAVGHLAMLFRSDFTGTPLVVFSTTGSHTFNAVAVGSYIAVVVAFDASSDYLYEISGLVMVRAPSASGDRAALIALFTATGGSNWTNRTNWSSDTPIREWHGVTTDANGRVTRLHLHENNLQGPIPLELGNLTNLEELGLFGNGLTGQIPPELGNLGNLKELWVDENALTGTLPRDLLSLTALEYISFQSNPGLCAPASNEFQQWLRSIDIVIGSSCAAAGSPRDRAVLVAFFNAMGGANWTNNANWLSNQPMREWHGVATDANGRVSGLVLHENNLRGTIPPELANLTELTALSLSPNPPKR